MTENPEFVYQIAVYLVFPSLVMWVLGLSIAKFSVKILGINKKILMPIIYVLCVIGAFLINHNSFDVRMMFVFGIVGILLRAMEIPSAPFLLGVILGPMADSNLRRALIISNGSLSPMLGRPICVIFLLVIAFMILSQMGLFKYVKKLGVELDRGSDYRYGGYLRLPYRGVSTLRGSVRDPRGGRYFSGEGPAKGGKIWVAVRRRGGLSGPASAKRYPTSVDMPTAVDARGGFDRLPLSRQTRALRKTDGSHFGGMRPHARRRRAKAAPYYP